MGGEGKKVFFITKLEVARWLEPVDFLRRSRGVTQTPLPPDGAGTVELSIEVEEKKLDILLPEGIGPEFGAHRQAEWVQPPLISPSFLVQEFSMLAGPLSSSVLGPELNIYKYMLAKLKIGQLLVQIRVVANEVPKDRFIKHFFLIP